MTIVAIVYWLYFLREALKWNLEKKFYIFRLQKKWDGAFVVNLKAPRNGARSTVQLLQKKNNLIKVSLTQ